MIRINREIQLGAILQFAGMLIAGIWMFASLSADIESLKGYVSRLSDRLDSHLYWHADRREDCRK